MHTNASRRASRVPSRRRPSVGCNKSTDKTTAASPLTGWNPVCLSRSAAVNPIKASYHLMRMSMTLPARVQSSSHSGADTHLPFPQSPATNAAADARLAKVMADTDLPLGARVAYAALVAMGEPRWLDLNAIAAAAGMTMGQARKFVPALERAGLVHRTNRVVHRNGQPSVRARYAVAVTA